MKVPVLYLVFISISNFLFAQTTMDEMWDNRSSGTEHKNIQWFKDAKFGMFIHWGLYSKLAGEWKNRRYYGSGEWIMNQAKIPVKEYQQVAASFNPVNFNAAEWAQLAEDAGIKYIVITAKHHEGFSMFDSKVTAFDIVDATPYRKDPMKGLSDEARKRNIYFGFYYSQFQDWYEPNGGRNSWDFKESVKDYQKYYREKAIPQLKELMSNYGPLGLIWFDTPGGMTRQQTQDFVSELRKYQPGCLFSSRVGQGLGDYRDFGDSEMPARPVQGAWESIYTHNDSWGYIKHDMNFKTSTEIIRLLAEAASKGGNLMLNIGPDGNGNIPPYSVKMLRETGAWLKRNAESIYATSSGLIPQQPWGFSTSKKGIQYLHILNLPANGKVFIPDFSVPITKVSLLENNKVLRWKKEGKGISIELPVIKTDVVNTVIKIEYQGVLNYEIHPLTVSKQFTENKLDAAMCNTHGNAEIKSFTYSHYYGDWKHTTCVAGLRDSTDNISFDLYIDEPGDYRVILDYNCGEENAMQEGKLIFNGQDFFFRTLKTANFDKRAPMQFVEHPIAITNIKVKGESKLTIQPVKNGKELFKLRAVYLMPVNQYKN